MFIDEVTLTIESGKGGDGIIAFRREKHVPLGGPAGGDGGRGGSVIFIAEQGISTLFDLRYRKLIRAKSGENGKPKNMSGADAEDTIVRVPVGTIIFDAGTNLVLADLVRHNQEEIIAQGGRGGRGNAAFASSRNKAPRIQENGEPGITLDLRIELKLLADVGIIGFPSVGKSTLISVVSQARPKIAAYPFTTIIPNLGVVEMPPLPPFVLADMPGIIEGASQGHGLGLQFLKHIERTRVLIHMIDFSPESGRDPYMDYQTVNTELKNYRYHLAERPQIIAANKMDVPGAQASLERFRRLIDPEVAIFPISAASRTGVGELMAKTYELLSKTPFFPIFEEKAAEVVRYEFQPEKPQIQISKIASNVFQVTGRDVEVLYQRSSFVSDEAVTRFLRQLRLIGVDDMLREKGAKTGDIIRILDSEFEYHDN